MNDESKQTNRQMNYNAPESKKNFRSWKSQRSHVEINAYIYRNNKLIKFESKSCKEFQKN